MDGSGIIRWTDKYGNYHRVGNPALVKPGGWQEWFVHGKAHRDGDLPAKVCQEFTSYFKDGVPHRDGDLPAVIYRDGTQIWIKEGKIHRTDGPAVCYHDSSRTDEWYFEGNRLLPPIIEGAKITVTGKTKFEALLANGQTMQIEYYRGQS